MDTQAGSLVSPTDTSLTDVILALCASGHFGVREAIAAATRQEPRPMGQNPSEASTTGTLTLATWRTENSDPLATPARHH
jgi:hypothetical protein